MAKRPTDTDSNVNRLRSIVNEMTGLKDPDDRMLEVMGVLTASPARSVVLVVLPEYLDYLDYLEMDQY